MGFAIATDAVAGRFRSFMSNTTATTATATSTSPASDSAPAPAPVSTAPAARRSGWLKTLHLWHWISSALCLLCMLLFSITGITLNHASQIEAKPKVTDLQATVPPPALRALQSAAQLPAPATASAASTAQQIPPEFAEWLARTWNVDAAAAAADAEWSPDEFYLPLPRPGGDAWLRVDLRSGEAEYEITDRGWISYLNDLHKGRNSGPIWGWFIDLFAVLCLLFSLTGLLILKFHAVSRPLTWPMVGLGVLVPFLLVLVFVH